MRTDLADSESAALVLFVCDNVDLADRLGPALYARGIDLHAVRSIDELSACLGSVGPLWDGRQSTLLLVDSGTVSDLADLRALASTLQAAGHPATDVLYLAPASDVQYRLAALRANLAECLDADLEPMDLAARIAARLGSAETEPIRVLVVDDQPVAALFAARVLEAAGMRTERVADAMAVLEEAKRFEPHLVLMDLHMPGASGIELTAIIRGQERFADLPIVFLSGEMDPHRQLDALRVGGDDFLAKPVQPAQLVDAVRTRLKRSRRMAREGPLSTRLDPRTGLATRGLLLKTLDRQIQSGQVAGWALIYLECHPDRTDIAGAAAQARALVEPADLAARAEESGIAVLARRPSDGALIALAESLGQAVLRGSGHLPAHADATTGRLGCADTLGIGWCPLSESGGDALTLVSRARKAARIGLRARKGEPVGYGKEIEISAGESVHNPIVAAILADQLQLLYQPMIALRGEMGERYEATPRLRTPDGELLAPARIAPLALRAGLGQRVDGWMLNAGLDALEACHSEGRPVELFIHQSLASAADDGWIDRVRDGIAARGPIGPPPVIQVQVGDADRNLTLAAQRAAQLERLGIRLCLNGLGEGERGQRVLDALPAAFVRLAAEAVRTLPLVRLKALVESAHARGALAIAAGVDGPQTVGQLYPARVDLIQGPYVQPPAESMEFDFPG
jgi:CheY-like chemotaxis protein/EAL domain-containing protein (putative c-di-GMP-specific phosphodiesterase class I)